LVFYRIVCDTMRVDPKRFPSLLCTRWTEISSSVLFRTPYKGRGNCALPRLLKPPLKSPDTFIAEGLYTLPHRLFERICYGYKSPRITLRKLIWKVLCIWLS